MFNNRMQCKAKLLNTATTEQTKNTNKASSPLKQDRQFISKIMQVQMRATSKCSVGERETEIRRRERERLKEIRN